MPTWYLNKNIMYAKNHRSRKNNYVKRFHTSVAQHSELDQQQNPQNINDGIYCWEDHQESGQPGFIIRYRKHIEFLERKLHSQQLVQEGRQHKYQDILIERDKLANKLKAISMDNQSLICELKSCKHQIKDYQQELQLYKLKETVQKLENDLREPEQPGMNKVSYKPIPKMGNPKNFSLFLETQSIKNRTPVKSGHKKFKIIQNISEIIEPYIDPNIIQQQQLRQQQEYKKLQKYEQAIALLNHRCELEMKKNRESLRLIAEKEAIIHNFCKENRELKIINENKENQYQQLQGQMIKREESYGQNLQQAEQATVNIKLSLEQIIRSLEQQMKEVSSKYNEITQELQDKNQQLRNKNQQLHNQSQQLSQLQAKIRKHEHQKETAKGSQDAHNSELSKIKQQKQKVEHNYADISKQLTEKHQQIQSLQQELTKHQLEKQRDLQAINKMNQQLKQRAEFIKKIKKTHEEALNQMNNTLKQSQDKLLDANNTLLNQIKQKDKSLSCYQEKLQQSEAENSQKQDFIKQLTNQMEKVKEMFQRQKTDRWSQTDESNSNMVNAKDLQAQIEAMMKEKNDQIVALQEDKQNLNEQLSALQKQLEQMSEEHERNQVFLQAAKSKIQQMSENVQRYQNQIIQKQGEICRLQKMIQDHEYKESQYRQYISKMRASEVSTQEY